MSVPEPEVVALYATLLDEYCEQETSFQSLS
jgi:hypothetical protein